MTDDPDTAVRSGRASGPVVDLPSQKLQFYWTVGQIAALWGASDIGYYFLLPALGQSPSYSTSSIAITVYYAFWVGMAVITFWPLYSQWARFESRFTGYIVWSLSFAGCTLFAAYVLPQLPSVDWKESWSPPELRVATANYFLPKSIEILFQQLLILALVLALSARDYSVRTISVICAAAFGLTHVLLAFSGVPTGYVIRFMVSAAAFGFVFPYLLLRVANGFAYSYMIHWLYYAVSVILPHLFLPAIK
jgi:hypothetical protein